MHANGEKLRVVVLGGGPSAEHEVSLKSAGAVFDALHPEKYEKMLATITKSGQWLIPGFWPMKEEEAATALAKVSDIVFIALHGEYGEDGTVQQLFERHGVRYTGSGPEASRLGMHKMLARDCFSKAGIAVPSGLSFSFDLYDRAPHDVVRTIAQLFQFPLITKPVSGGSSVGVCVVHAFSDLELSIHNVFHYAPYALVEELVSGVELSCGVLEGARGRVVPLLPTEIIPKKAEYFDYESKYSDGGAEEITPARVPKSIVRRAQEVAVSAHQTLGCRGYSRTDMIWNKTDNKLYALEINTLPGLTAVSILPRAAAASGIRFDELLDRIIASVKEKA